MHHDKLTIIQLKYLPFFILLQVFSLSNCSNLLLFVLPAEHAFLNFDFVSIEHTPRAGETEFSPMGALTTWLAALFLPLPVLLRRVELLLVNVFVGLGVLLFCHGLLHFV